MRSAAARAGPLAGSTTSSARRDGTSLPGRKTGWSSFRPTRSTRRTRRASPSCGTCWQAGARPTSPGIERPERARQVAAFVSDLRALSLGEPAARRPRALRDGALHIPVHHASHPRRDRRHLPLQQRLRLLLRGMRDASRGMRDASRGTAARPTPRDLSAGKEMSLPEVKRIIRMFKDEAKIPFFSFTGGEPLLREDLEEMIRFAEQVRTAGQPHHQRHPCRPSARARPFQGRPSHGAGEHRKQRGPQRMTRSPRARGPSRQHWRDPQPAAPPASRSRPTRPSPR